MNTVWQVAMILMGVFTLYCSITDSDNVFYRRMTWRTRRIWGNQARYVTMIPGALLTVLGIVLITGVI